MRDHDATSSHPGLGGEPVEPGDRFLSPDTRNVWRVTALLTHGRLAVIRDGIHVLGGQFIPNECWDREQAYCWSVESLREMVVYRPVGVLDVAESALRKN